MAVSRNDASGVNERYFGKGGNGRWGFTEYDIKYTTFGNIGAGIGHFMGKLNIYGRNPTIDEWYKTVYRWNGEGNDAERYQFQVWTRYIKYGGYH